MGRTQHAEQSVTYVLDIDDWDYPYTIWTRVRDDDPDPLFEYEVITVSAALRVPALPSYPRATVTIWPMTELNHDVRRRQSLRQLGWLETADKRLQISLHMPREKVPALITVLAARVHPILTVSGTPLFRRRGTVTGFSFAKSLTIEDLNEANEAWRIAKRKRSSR